MKIKTNELTGAALDWAVAKCEGRATTFGSKVGEKFAYYPSRKWADGGKIIERERICVDYVGTRSDQWCAQVRGAGKDWLYGPTPLVAAMRVYVALKLGVEVDVPGELSEATEDA